MSGIGIVRNHKLEELPENDDLVQEEEEEDEVNIDDEFEDIEECNECKYIAIENKATYLIKKDQQNNT